MGTSTYNNTSEKGWIVQKFGGTSVGKFPDKVRASLLFLFLVSASSACKAGTARDVCADASADLGA